MRARSHSRYLVEQRRIHAWHASSSARTRKRWRLARRTLANRRQRLDTSFAPQRLPAPDPYAILWEGGA